MFAFLLFCIFVNVNLNAQDNQNATIIQQVIKASCPNISDKDLKNFVYSLALDEPYGLGVDSQKQDSVPEGTITKYHWVNKTIYVGTQRDYWLYVPKQYDSSKPACLMIFQDGWGYLDQDVMANIVLDNDLQR